MFTQKYSPNRPDFALCITVFFAIMANAANLLAKIQHGLD